MEKHKETATQQLGHKGIYKMRKHKETVLDNVSGGLYTEKEEEDIMI